MYGSVKCGPHVAISCRSHSAEANGSQACDEPGYKNLASLIERAEGELESESQLSSWYSNAKSHIALEEWNEALAFLDQVYDRDEGFRDVAALLDQVRSKILIPCPGCGTLTPAGHKFCGKCGSPIASWTCWRCQSPVPEGRRFCGKCGAPRIEPSTATCPKCGSRNPTGRKFCSRCGEPLAQ